jgi:hypothetical protein
MSETAVFDRERLLARVFPPEPRQWSAAQAVRWARDFGAGLPGELAAHDARFLDAQQALALPMIAVPLCDGEFWQQQPDTGIDWRRIVHAEEVLTLHRPLPLAGQALLTQAITDIRDRGAEKGALMVQRLTLAEPGGLPYADVDVTTVLRGNGGFGGFGGPPPDAARPAPLPERAPDASIDIRTPSAGDTSFCLSAELKVGDGLSLQPGQRMLRGVGCFGLAGRAALALACGNDPQRLRRFGVRYGGPMFSDETMRLELWHVGEGQAVFRMRAVERDAAVLSHGTLAWSL